MYILWGVLKNTLHLLAHHILTFHTAILIPESKHILQHFESKLLNLDTPVNK